MQIPFTKMHGLGNDFVVIDGVSRKVALDAAQIKALGDRRFGIGFDQLLLVEPPGDPNVDFNYRIFNVDGSEVEHCGNGARCFARFVREKGLSDRNPVRVKTVNRVLILETDSEGMVTVDMGEPELAPEKIPLTNPQRQPVYERQLRIADEETAIAFSAVSMGNPHAVILVEDLSQAAVKDIGEALGNHPDFPQGVNVGFMQVINRQEIRLRVFERGTGETLACGTGACAAAVAGRNRGLLDDKVSVRLAGGYLKISWQGEGSSVLMSRPGNHSLRGDSRTMSNDASTAENLSGSSEDELNVEQVVAYLQAHPDFFLEQDDLLAELSLPHESGKAISLLERQVTILRERGIEARQKLNNLLENARNNDQLFDTTRNLVLALLRARGVTEIANVAVDQLSNHDSIDACEMILVEHPDMHVAQSIRVEPLSSLKSTYGDVFRLKRTHCGAIDKDQIEMLFPNQQAAIRSTALCPVISNGEVLALLALGNQAENYFNVNLDTLFLDFIGHVVGAVLDRQLDLDCP